MNRVACTLLLLAAASTNALAPESASFVGRRNFFGLLGSGVAGAAALAAKAGRYLARDAALDFATSRRAARLRAR